MVKGSMARGDGQAGWTMGMRRLLFILVLGLSLLAGCAPAAQEGRGEPTGGSQNEQAAPGEEGNHEHASGQPAGAGASQEAVEIPHLHGLGYSPDGERLFVAAHDGFRLFEAGSWSAPDLPAHDYMGYSASDDGFYSSGHPAPSSGLVNPLGLVKSTDGGQTLIRLGFEGESDFHLMGVGYQSHAIYLLNPSPNSRLQGAGLFYSLDDGETWNQSSLQGVTHQPLQIVVHPVEPGTLAMPTEGGLLLSTDHGERFERVGEAGPATSAAFHPVGDQLYAGYQSLAVYDLASGEGESLPPVPIDPDDAIAFIAVNPANPDEITLATFKRNVLRTEDRGQSWEIIAREGWGS